MANDLVVPTTNAPVTQPPSPANDSTLPPPAPAPETQDLIDENTAADMAVEQMINLPPAKPSMQAVMANAIKSNPDREAEAQKIALRTGVPVQTVFAHPDEMKGQAALNDIDFNSYEKLYPASAVALSNVELAKVAHDDIDNMGYTENILRGIGGRTVNLAGGLMRFQNTVAQELKDNGITLPANVWPAQFLAPETRDEVTQSLEKFNLGYQPRTTWEQVKDQPLSNFLPFALEQGLVSIPDMAAAVFAPEVYFTALTGEMGQNRAQNDERQAATVGDFIKVAPGAAANALLERFATRGIVGADSVATTSFKQIGKEVGKAALKEGATEAGQNLAQYASETVGTKKGFDFAEAGEQALQGAVAGAPFGGAVRGTTASIEMAVNRTQAKIAEAKEAEKNAQNFEDLNTLAAESKLRPRDTLAFQKFVDDITQSEGVLENVYVDPKALAQSGIPIEEIAKFSPSVAQQYQSAIELGTDIKIPVSEYQTYLAGTELGQAMVDHLKTDPLGMSRAEAQEFTADGGSEALRKQVELAVQEQEKIDAFKTSADAVYNDVFAKLNTVNKFSQDVNKQYAALISSFYKVQAAELGITPEAAYQNYNVNVRGSYDTGNTLSMNANQNVEQNLNQGTDGRNPTEEVQDLYPAEMTARGSYNTETNTITLLKRADLSTFLHESGHFFLETMNKIALSETAPERIKNDMQTVFDWLGVKDIQEWNANDLEWQREKHEQFARGFEAYLFEGKSPSLEMRKIFQRFRAWLINVYQTLTALDVELNDEVRGVFDRMLATTEEIKEAELARSYEPMFATAQEAGMSSEEWQQYQELGLQATQNAITSLESRSLRDLKFASNAKSRALKDLQRQAAGRRREIRDQVTKEVMAEPVNQARQFLTRGEFNIPDDAPQFLRRAVTELGGQSTKLSLPALKEMYGEEGNAIWRYLKKGKYGEVGKEGIHPDQAAELFGFNSGDALVRALVSEENAKEKIAGITDQRMLERYGELIDPASIERAADEAIHNEVRGRFVATELNALQRATGARKILTAAARGFAENMISALKVRDLSAARYSAAEARAARAAEEALRKGEIPLAAVEKRNQLIHNYAAKAAHEAQREVERAVQYFKGFQREGTRKNLDSDYLDQIDALLDRFDLRKGQSLKAIDRRTSLRNWLDAREEEGLAPAIPEELLDEAMRKHFKDMTVEEVRGLRDTIKQIEHLGRVKNKLLTAKDNREFKAIVGDLIDSIVKNADGRQVDNTSRPIPKDELVRLFKGFVAAHRKVSSLARELDGFEDGGLMWEYVIRPMNFNGDKEASMRAKSTKEVAKIVTPIMKEGHLGGKGEEFKSIGRNMNREERIAIALNMGNKGNIQRLLDGEGWTSEQIKPVLDTLTKEEWDFVQNIWDFFETFRPEIGAKEKRLYGKEPNWVEPTPVQTKFGEYRGGYYPIKYDSRKSLAAEQHNDAELAKQQLKGAYTSATTRRSFTKTRADEVKGRPLLYSFDGIYSGINEIIHDLAWHEWLIDMNRLFRNKGLDGAIRNGYGADVVTQFKTAIRDIAGGEMPSGTTLDKGLQHLRSGAVFAGLGFNLVNTLINTTGMVNSIVRIGPKWVFQGLGQFAADPKKSVKEVYEKSEFMQLRSQTMMRELNEIRNIVRGRSKAREMMNKMMFMPLTLTQIAVDVPSWLGAYNKAVAEGNNEERSVALADQAVLDAQSGGQIKDLARVQRGGQLSKLFTTFYGYFSAVYNLTVEKTKATDFKDPLSVLKLGGDYLLLYTVPVVLGRLIQTALTGGQDDWDPEKLAKNLANDQISYLMGTMVGLRELTGAVQTVATTNQYSSTYGGPAGLRFFSEAYKLATQISQGEADQALLKSIVNVAGILFHLPSTQINRTLTGADALIEGDTKNPAVIVGGASKNK